MSNFQIIYPHIPVKTRITTAPLSDQDDIDSIALGDLSGYFMGAQSITNLTVAYDTGSTATLAPDVVGMIGAQSFLRAGLCSITVQNATDSAFTSPATYNSGTLSESQLIGDEKDTLILSPTGLLATARYIRCSLIHSVATKKRFSKLFLGNVFDFGSEPIYPIDIRFDGKTSKRPRITGELRFPSISITLFERFYREIYLNHHLHTYILWDKLGHTLPNAVYCFFRTIRIDRDVLDRFNVLIQFEELQ